MDQILVEINDRFSPTVGIKTGLQIVTRAIVFNHKWVSVLQRDIEHITLFPFQLIRSDEACDQTRSLVDDNRHNTKIWWNAFLCEITRGENG